MSRASLERAIAKHINAEQHTGGRLAQRGDGAHPATIAEIVVDVLVNRGIVNEQGEVARIVNADACRQDRML